MSKGIFNSNKKLKEAAEKYAKGDLQVEVATPKKNGGGGRKRKNTDADEEGPHTPAPTSKKRDPRKKAVLKKEGHEDGDSSGPG